MGCRFVNHLRGSACRQPLPLRGFLTVMRGRVTFRELLDMLYGPRSPTFFSVLTALLSLQWPEKTQERGLAGQLSVGAGAVDATTALLNRLIKRYCVVFMCGWVWGEGGVVSDSYPCRMLLQ